MWVYVLVGNIVRGMGETPILPLGISYIEDFAKSENSPLYIGKFWKSTLASFQGNKFLEVRNELYFYSLSDFHNDEWNVLAQLAFHKSLLNGDEIC